MLTYATVGSNHLTEAKKFYDELLGAIGVMPLFEHPNGGWFYGTDGKIIFAVLKPFDGGRATVGNGAMCGFGLESREKVTMFHAKALELGGTSEGEPGLRGPEELGAYFAYFRDLDGNKFCAFKYN